MFLTLNLFIYNYYIYEHQINGIKSNSALGNVGKVGKKRLTGLINNKLH